MSATLNAAKMNATKAPALRFFGVKDLDNTDAIPQLNRLSPDVRRQMRVVAQVLPFRVNSYVIDELIDWDNIPADPIFQLTFPQPGMLTDSHHERIERVLDAGPQQLYEAIKDVRDSMNPHPEGQMTHNVPKLEDQRVPGVQHKYSQTCLVFPSAGQTCHAYCTFCFRWAQFVGDADLKFATDQSMLFQEYIRRHHEISDVLITGGDPMVMRAGVLARYIEPLLTDEFSHVQTIRIGTKALSYWPYRFLTDRDSDELIRLLARVTESGKQLAVMGHFNHGRELETPAAELAIRRLQSIGATIRTQSPIVRSINDDSDVWATMWNKQVRLGCIPYYMFVERDTGAKHYFKMPLHRALDIYRDAMMDVSGIGRTARGPVMSALPGKVMIDGTAEIHGEKVFSLSFLQARNHEWCKRPFFAKYDEDACWLNELQPAFGEKEFFYESELRQMLAANAPTVQPSFPVNVLAGSPSA